MKNSLVIALLVLVTLISTSPAMAAKSFQGTLNLQNPILLRNTSGYTVQIQQGAAVVSIARAGRWGLKSFFITGERTFDLILGPEQFSFSIPYDHYESDEKFSTDVISSGQPLGLQAVIHSQVVHVYEPREIRVSCLYSCLQPVTTIGLNNQVSVTMQPTSCVSEQSVLSQKSDVETRMSIDFKDGDKSIGSFTTDSNKTSEEKTIKELTACPG